MRGTLKIETDFITLVKKIANNVPDFITLLVLNKVIKYKIWCFVNGY